MYGKECHAVIVRRIVHYPSYKGGDLDPSRNIDGVVCFIPASLTYNQRFRSRIL